MLGDSSAVRVHMPESLLSALQVKHRIPDIRIVNGGTSPASLEPGGGILSLHLIEELERIGRTERSLDLGATATLEQIIRVGEKVVPRVLHDGIRSIAPLSVRNVATLAGNLCHPTRILTAGPVLNCLESEVELRRQGGARRLPVSRLRNAEGKLILEPDEICTRIRVPLEHFSHERFFRSGAPYVPDAKGFVFAAVARVERGLVGSIRMAAATLGPRVFRNRELEAEIVGRRSRFTTKEAQNLSARWAAPADNDSFGMDPFQRELLRRLISAFLRGLVDEPQI